MEVQLGHRVLAMPLDRVRADPQQIADFPAGSPFGNQPHDLPLPIRERFDAFGLLVRADLIEILAEQPLVERAVQVNLPLGHRSHGHEQFVGQRALEDESGSARLDALEEIAFVLEHGEGQDADVGKFRLNVPRGLQSSRAGHGNIHDNDLGAEFAGLFNRFLSIGRLAHHFHIRLPLQERADAGPDKGMVLGQENANSSHHDNPMREEWEPPA